MFTNDTSKEFAEKRNASTLYTGKDDIKEIGQYIDYEGITQTDIWAEPITVTGTGNIQYHIYMIIIRVIAVL